MTTTAVTTYDAFPQMLEGGSGAYRFDWLAALQGSQAGDCMANH